MPVLEVDDLYVSIGDTEILRGVSFAVDAGETLGVVGESGCGKSMTGLAVMGMLPAGGRVTKGSIKLDGRELTTLSQRQWRDIRGQEIALVMQDPFTSLNPLMKVGEQIAEVYRFHGDLPKKEARDKAIEMLKLVGVPSPEASAQKYPHQMSGGQRQRVVIAIAFAARPKVLIADEPTTALDVTLQAQILRLLTDLQSQIGTAVVVISHDIGVIGSIADKMSVYYAGTVAEHGTAPDVLTKPFHPYTQALMRSIPTVGRNRLDVISGQPPLLANLPEGCPFRPRCPHAFDKCLTEPPLLPTPSQTQATCWLAESEAVART